MNLLNAAFWDYPQFADENYLKDILLKSADMQTRLWILRRFLEYARVVDTWKFFDMKEIARHLPELNLKPYSEKKWKRMIEVYGETERE